MARPKYRNTWHLWVILLIFLGSFLLWGTASTVQTKEESNCVSCHTNSRELIKLSQIILKMHPPAKSESIKGEG